MTSANGGDPNGSPPNQQHEAEEEAEKASFSDNPAVAEGQSPTLDVLVAKEIVPRLLVAHSGETGDLKGARTPKFRSTEIEQFAELPLSREVDELLLEVEGFLKRGVDVESVYTDLLAASARRIGEHWESDSCDFVDVSMALWRLQEVMHEISTRFPVQKNGPNAGRSALFTPMPGEQHSFGTLMVEEVFARAGWDSEALLEPQRSELLQIVSERPFELVGLTVSNDCPSRELAGLISAIRSASKCRGVKIIIGGRAINANPGLVSLVGADGTAPDARSALILADRLVRTQPSETLGN